MATATDHYVSADDIAYSWLLRRGKTIHYYWKVLPLVAEAIRELSLTNQPLIKHTILNKPDGQTWFNLPPDYTDWISAGVRLGEYWRPVGISNRLMPFPRRKGNGEFNPEEFSGHPNQFNVTGEFTNWVNPDGVVSQASFWMGDFSGVDYQLGSTNTGGGSGSGGDGYLLRGLVPYGIGSGYYWSDWFNDWGEIIGRSYGIGDGYRPDVISINPELGLIMCPSFFPSNHLYFVYSGIGTVDTMTHVPVKAQAAIEAYVSWKYEANKRGAQLRTLNDLERQFAEQMKLLNMRNLDLSVTDIRRIINKNYGQTQPI